MGSLEVGNIYAGVGETSSSTKFFLAVEKQRLITVVNSTVVLVQATEKYTILRMMPIDELLLAWKITSHELDLITIQFFNPASHRNSGVRQRRERRREDGASELESFRRMRLHRFSGPGHKST